MSSTAIRHRRGQDAAWSGQALLSGELGLRLDGSNIPTYAKIGNSSGTWLGATKIEFFLSADRTKLDGIAAGAGVNPAQVSGGEKTAGTETALRLFAPVDVKEMAVTFGGGTIVSVFGRDGSGTSGAISAASGDYTADQITDTGSKVLMTPAERTIISGLASNYAGITHASRHKTGGADAIKLDELAAPTDVTTLNATTSAHGLLKKLPNDAYQFLDGAGNWGSNCYQRVDTAANFTANNPTLKLGQVGRESDTYRTKIGDGSTTWTNLGYERWFACGGTSAEVNTSASEQTVFSVTIPKNTLPLVGSRCRWFAHQALRNSSGGGQTVIGTAKVGGSVIAARTSISAGSGGTRTMYFVGELLRINTSLVMVQMQQWIGPIDEAEAGAEVGSGAVLTTMLAGGRTYGSARAGTSATFTGDITFGLYYTMSASNANLGVQTLAWSVEKVF
jgi:hypothetical protein